MRKVLLVFLGSPILRLVALPTKGGTQEEPAHIGSLAVPLVRADGAAADRHTGKGLAVLRQDRRTVTWWRTMGAPNGKYAHAVAVAAAGPTWCLGMRHFSPSRRHFAF